MSDFNLDDLKLEPGEGVILHATDIWSFDGNNEHNFDDLYLTNKHLIRVTENTKFLGKSDTRLEKFPFGAIKEAKRVNDEEYGDCLRLTYISGKSELYEFCESPKRDHPRWESAISDAIHNTKSNNTQPCPASIEVKSPETKYKYCSNCGTKYSGEVKFCHECGASFIPVQPKAQTTPPPITPPEEAPTNRSIQPEQSQERKTVYAGTIQKCPNCGEALDSFAALCPSCGYEIKGKQVSTTLQKFIEQINECDRLIANTPQSKSGWASWDQSKKIGWVILNIFFMCIPLVIYLVLPLLLIKATPKLTNEEKQKASIIQNFSFPNDRESILAALIFAKEKIDFISKENIDRKSAYWMRLWCAKAEQLKQKADMLFPEDKIVKENYAEIVADDERVKKAIKTKAIIGGVILVVSLVLFVATYHSEGSVDNYGEDTDYSATFEWQTNGLFAELPEPNSNNGKIVMETEQQVSFEVYNIDTADFESYVKSCREAGFTIGITKTEMVFYAKDEEGYNLSIFYYDDKDKMNVVVNSYDLFENQTEATSTEPTSNVTNSSIVYTLDYEDAKSFEDALNNGEKVKGSVVKFALKKYEPESAFGPNCQAGEHLNFILEDDADVKENSVIICKVNEEPYRFLGTWIIGSEIIKIENE